MNFELRTFEENDVVVCVLEKPQTGKAIPYQATLENYYEAHDSPMNYLNELELPGKPALFWIQRGYNVYSSLVEDKTWFQICLSRKSKSEKLEDLAEYKDLFIVEKENEMCTEPGCHAYMTFDLCKHTLPENLHYMVYDYP